MYLIGISGKKQTGKNTVADLIEAQFLASSVAKIAFADALKEEVAKACGVTVAFIEANKTLFRPILQWWGTEFRRKLKGEDYWVKQVLKKLVDLPPSVKLAIITDVRFVNEAKMVNDASGYLLRVNRDTGFIDGHASEKDLDGWLFDCVISNDSSLEELQLAVQGFLIQHKLK